MDGNDFDSLTRKLGGLASRRQAVAGLFGAAVAATGLSAAAKNKGKTRRGRRTASPPRTSARARASAPLPVATPGAPAVPMDRSRMWTPAVTLALRFVCRARASTRPRRLFHLRQRRRHLLGLLRPQPDLHPQSGIQRRHLRRPAASVLHGRPGSQQLRFGSGWPRHLPERGRPERLRLQSNHRQLSAAVRHGLGVHRGLRPDRLLVHEPDVQEHLRERLLRGSDRSDQPAGLLPDGRQYFRLRQWRRHLRRLYCDLRSEWQLRRRRLLLPGPPHAAPRISHAARATSATAASSATMTCEPAACGAA